MDEVSFLDLYNKLKDKKEIIILRCNECALTFIIFMPLIIVFKVQEFNNIEKIEDIEQIKTESTIFNLYNVRNYVDKKYLIGQCCRNFIIRNS